MTYCNSQRIGFVGRRWLRVEREDRANHPAHVKQTVCGYGRADKGQVQRMVRAILSLDAEPATSHEADALAVAICHALASPLARLVR